MDKKRQERAVATAREYDQGDIAGLDDKMTRRLVASTVYTESNGGDLAITNKQGYVGRYQAGAGWLVDAGYIDADKFKSAMAGYRSEWAWAESGGMTRFLQDASNWKQGLSLDKYKQSADLQDQAFKRNCDGAYRQALRNNVLHADDDQEKIAGFMKARHIAGYSGAAAVLQGKPPRADANGTSNYDYYNDIVRNRDGLDQPMTQLGKAASAPTPLQHPQVHAEGSSELRFGSRGNDVAQLQGLLVGLGYSDAHGNVPRVDRDFGRRTEEAVKAFQRAHGLHVDGVVGDNTRAALAKADRTPLLSERTHPDNPMFQQVRNSLKELHGAPRSEAELDRVSAAVTTAAKQAGIRHIDHVMMNTRGDSVIAVQGNLQDPAKTFVAIDKAQAAGQSLEQSSAQLAEHMANRQQQSAQHTQMEHMEHRAGLTVGMRP